LPHRDESSRYTVRPVKHKIDIRNQDDTATFEGVYALNDGCLTLAWDTVGEGRPQSVLEADRFGLNRITLRKA
jgi:hypothetical protein